jgi:hypothetical protein
VASNWWLLLSATSSVLFDQVALVDAIHHACLRDLTVGAVWAAVAAVSSTVDQSKQAPAAHPKLPSSVTKESDP